MAHVQVRKRYGEKQMKYVIIGFTKCGTTALEKYMKDNGEDVVRNEVLFYSGENGSYNPDVDGREFYDKHYSDRIPILIMRDPIKRIFSQYHYKQRHQKGDIYEIKENNLKDALNNHYELLTASDYDRYLELWKDKKPIILYFEDVIKWDNFPHENKCNCGIKPTEKEINLIKNSINYKIHERYN